MTPVDNWQQVMFRQALNEGPGRNGCTRILGADNEETSVETYFSVLEWVNGPCQFNCLRMP